MKLSKKAKKVFLYGTESRTTRQDRWIPILKFRLFVRDRDGIWIQVTENTELVEPIFVVYDKKKGCGFVQQPNSRLCDFTDAMLFWEDAIVPCNLICFTKEEDKEEFNILKISANGRRISETFDKYLVWADELFMHSNLLHSNLLEDRADAIQMIGADDLGKNASDLYEGEQG